MVGKHCNLKMYNFCEILNVRGSVRNYIRTTVIIFQKFPRTNKISQKSCSYKKNYVINEKRV